MAALNLTLMRGTTGLFSVSVTLADGTTPDDIAGDIVYFKAHFKGVSRGTPYDVYIVKSSDGNGITITDEAEGLARIEIAPEDTTGLPDVSPARGIFSTQCDLELRHIDQLMPLNTGTLTVLSNVGDPPA